MSRFICKHRVAIIGGFGISLITDSLGLDLWSWAYWKFVLGAYLILIAISEAQT